MEFSMAETVILAMGLRVLMQGELKPTDRKVAEELFQKLSIKHKGQEIKLILFGK